MKKRGRSFKGQIFGAGRAATAARDEAREMRTETVARLILAHQPGQPLEKRQILGLLSGARLGLEGVRTGKASEDDIGWLVNAVNMALILTELGFGPDYAERIRAAQDGLMAMLARHERTGRYALDGPGWLACVDALDIHEAQITSEDLTDKDVLRAIEIIKKRQELGRVLELEAATS